MPSYDPARKPPAPVRPRSLWQWLLVAGRGRARQAPREPEAGADFGRPLPQITDYALESVVARHDRSTVYRARHRSSGQVVALKTLRLEPQGRSDPSLWRERFLREAAAAARLTCA